MNEWCFRPQFCTVKAIRNTVPETTWANQMGFDMNHAFGAGSIARPVGQQSRALPLYNGCLPDSAGIV